MYPNVCGSIFYNSFNMEPRCPLTDEWIQKLWYIHTVEYDSAIKKKNAFNLVLMK